MSAHTELQKAKEEERHMNSVKLSFEKQLQSERTLKIQVRFLFCVRPNLLDIYWSLHLCTVSVCLETNLYLLSLRSQAVNKLAEIMNRRETVRGGHRGNETEVRRKEKENRKLQLELRSEKEKLNSTIIKYQREINDTQAVSVLIRGDGGSHQELKHSVTPRGSVGIV